MMRVMAEAGADFTLTFRYLCDAAGPSEGEDRLRSLFAGQPDALDAWLGKWRARMAPEECTAHERREGMRAANPMFIARNHRVEEALAAATSGFYGPFEKLLEVLERPFDDQPENSAYADPPRPDEIVQATFCGT